MTKEKFIAIMMLYGMPKDEAEELAKSFIFERDTRIEEVDGEEVELDELSYEVGYTRGQRAERAKGKWKHHKTKSNKNWYECDSCGWVHFQRSNFCPFCGADMRGKE